jgi:hypothetical protein
LLCIRYRELVRRFRPFYPRLELCPRITLDEQTVRTPSFSIVCIAVLFSVSGAYAGGVYQRTKDGQTFVWNNYPRPGDEATWSGNRNPAGYATGYGTLTWYKRNIVISSYTGNMAQGKLDGLVTNVDANGKVFHGTFVQGNKSADWAAGPGLALPQPTTEHVYEGALGETPAQGSNRLQSMAPLASPLPNPSPPSPSVSTSIAIAPAIKDRMIADFKEQTQSVLSRVAEGTSNFREIDRLESANKLAAPVSESIGSLADRARDFREKLGYETALQVCRAETETVDALLSLDQATRNIAANDASAASAKLGDFLKNNPEPSVDSQKPLWRYLKSIQVLCSRLEKDAGIHVQRAHSLVSAGKTSDAIREYQEAYRIFPNPAVAEKIRELQDSSLGL